jgi:hypothetical protein
MTVSTLSLVAPDEMDGRIARGARARTAIVDAPASPISGTKGVFALDSVG